MLPLTRASAFLEGPWPSYVWEGSLALRHLVGLLGPDSVKSQDPYLQGTARTGTDAHAWSEVRTHDFSARTSGRAGTVSGPLVLL